MDVKRLILTIALITGALVLSAAPVHAGGITWWSFEGHDSRVEPVLAWGDEVHASVRFSFGDVQPKRDHSPYGGGLQDGPYFGYLVRRFGPNVPFPPHFLPGRALLIGQLIFAETDDHRIKDVSLDFVMPELEPGSYALVHCNDPCTRQLGTTVSMNVSIVEDRGQAFIANRLNHVERRLRVGHSRLVYRVRTLARRAENLKSVVRTMEDKIDSLEQAAALTTRRDPAPPPKSNLSMFSWTLFASIGMVLILVFRTIRSFLSSRRSPGAV